MYREFESHSFRQTDKMKNKLLVWCGDSWTAGHGLSDIKQDRFSTIIQNNLSVDTINLARSNTSIGHLVYKLSQILRIKYRFPNKELLVLFGLTVPTRLCVETDTGKKLTISVNSFDTTAYKNWAVDVFSNRQSIKESCIAISWLAQQCKNNNIEFRFYNILSNFYDFEKSSFVQYLNPEDWIVSPYWSTYGELFDLDNLNLDKVSILEKSSFGKAVQEKYILSDKHPNVAGHKKIADRLTNSLVKIL